MLIDLLYVDRATVCQTAVVPNYLYLSGTSRGCHYGDRVLSHPGPSLVRPD